jgi:hypothetical protein
MLQINEKTNKFNKLLWYYSQYTQNPKPKNRSYLQKM